MAQVKILKRSQDAVSCSSCKQRYDSIEALDQHLETSLTGRRICPKTQAPALIVCIGCERDFSSIQELKQHVQNSFLHHPELSKPTGRVVFVGRLPANVREQDVVNTLFEGFIVETTSMRTHCPHFDNFAFITLTTAAEANRAVKELHKKRLFDQKVVVSLQRSKKDSAIQSSGRKPPSRILGMTPSVAYTRASTKSAATASGKENTGPLLPVSTQLPQTTPAYVQPTSPPFDPRIPAFPYNPNSPAVYNQSYPSLPYHPPPLVSYGHPAAIAPFRPAPVNHNFRVQNASTFVPSGFLPATQHLPQKAPEQRPRRQRGRRKQFPPQYDGPSDSPTALLPIVAEPRTSMLPTNVNAKYDPAIQTSTPGTASTFCTTSITEPSYYGNLGKPPLDTSGPVSEARAWTSFRDVDKEMVKKTAAIKAEEEARAQAAVDEDKGKAARDDDKRVEAVHTKAMPTLVPTPANEIADELQICRGPSAVKKRKGCVWRMLD